jgi:hypothetical protein
MDKVIPIDDLDNCVLHNSLPTFHFLVFD